MMIEKWYTAYQEALHVPVVVRFPRVAVTRRIARPSSTALDHAISTSCRPCSASPASMRSSAARSRTQLAMSRPVPPLPGVDLSGMIEKALRRPRADGGDRARRRGARGRIVHHRRRDHRAAAAGAHGSEKHSYEEYAVYQEGGRGGAREARGKDPVALSPGEVKQPNHVRCVRTSRLEARPLFRPVGQGTAGMGDVRPAARDPNEAVNLVEVVGSPPTARADLPERTKVQAAADKLAALLARLEKRDL